MKHVFEQKDLGVTVDSELTFEEHISAKIRVVNAIVGLIRRSFTFLDGSMLTRLYAALVRSHLEYAQSVWAPHTKICINLLKNMQIRATKLVNGLDDMEYKKRLIRLKLPTLANRRRRDDMIEIYKHFKSYDRNSISTSFQPKERKSRKHKLQLYYKKPRGIQHYSYYFRTSKLWNNLPSEEYCHQQGWLNILHWKNIEIKYLPKSHGPLIYICGTPFNILDHELKALLILLFMCAYVCVCVRARAHVRVRARVQVCVRARVHVCMGARMHGARMHVCVWVQVCTCAPVSACT